MNCIAINYDLISIWAEESSYVKKGSLKIVIVQIMR